MAYRLNQPLKFFKKQTTVSSEGDAVTVLIDERVIFSNCQFRENFKTDNDTPRQQMKLRCIIRAREDLDSWKPRDYKVLAFNRVWEVDNLFPDEKPGYWVLLLREEKN